MAKITGWYEATYKSGRVAKSFPKNPKHQQQMLKELEYLKKGGSVVSYRWIKGAR